MLFLQFQIGDDHYAIGTGRVAEVLPLVSIKRIPQSTPGIAGVFNYRGRPVPLIDLTQLTVGRPADKRLSTRVILVHVGNSHEGERVLGLIAEKATETIKRDPEEFVASGVTSDAAPWLGSVAPTESGRLLQRIDVEQILPADVSRALFRRIEEGSCPAPHSKLS